MTIKPELHGPVVRVRHLMMQRYRLVSRKFRGGVNILSHFEPRCGTLTVVEQLRSDGSRQCLELRHRMDPKSPQQDRTVLLQFSEQTFTFVAAPVRDM